MAAFNIVPDLFIELHDQILHKFGSDALEECRAKGFKSIEKLRTNQRYGSDKTFNKNLPNLPGYLKKNIEVKRFLEDRKAKGKPYDIKGSYLYRRYLKAKHNKVIDISFFYEKVFTKYLEYIDLDDFISKLKEAPNLSHKLKSALKEQDKLTAQDELTTKEFSEEHTLNITCYYYSKYFEELNMNSGIAIIELKVDFAPSRVTRKVDQVIFKVSAFEKIPDKGGYKGENFISYSGTLTLKSDTIYIDLYSGNSTATFYMTIPLGRALIDENGLRRIDYLNGVYTGRSRIRDGTIISGKILFENNSIHIGNTKLRTWQIHQMLLLERLQIRLDSEDIPGSKFFTRKLKETGYSDFLNNLAGKKFKMFLLHQKDTRVMAELFLTIHSNYRFEMVFSSGRHEGVISLKQGNVLVFESTSPMEDEANYSNNLEEYYGIAFWNVSNYTPDLHEEYSNRMDGRFIWVTNKHITGIARINNISERKLKASGEMIIIGVPDDVDFEKLGIPRLYTEPGTVTDVKGNLKYLKDGMRLETELKIYRELQSTLEHLDEVFYNKGDEPFH